MGNWKTAFGMSVLVLLAAVLPALAQPTIGTINPAQAIAGSQTNLQIAITGTNFVLTSPGPGSVVLFGTEVLPTDVTSTTALTAIIPSNLLTTAGTVNITVRNPDNATSAPSAFTIIGVPTTSQITPNEVVAGAPDTAVTITGTNFVSNSIVLFGATELTPSAVNSTQISVTIPAVNLASAATVNVAVRNPGNQNSNAQTFTITAPPPAPTLTLLSPNVAPARRATDAPVPLTVTGTGFVNGAVVLFGAETLSATWVSATELTTTIPAAQLGTPGNVGVTVRNPDNQNSNALQFTIQPVTPTLNSISPTSTVAGSATFTLTLNGSNFLPGATVLFGAQPLPPSLGSISNTEITVTVPSALVATAGSISVRVSNLGDALSQPQTFTVVPVLTLSYQATIPGIKGTAITPANPTRTGGVGPFQYTLASGSAALPAGLNLDETTGVISGTPTPAAESAQVTVQVRDSSNPPQTATSQTIAITINNPGLQIVTLSPLPTGVAGIAYTALQLVATGGDSTYTWTVPSGQASLPSGMTLSSAGLLSGTPLAAGVFQFTARVTDGANANVERQYSLTITPVISALSPNFRAAGSTDLVLQISGFGFVGGATVVNFGTTQIPTGSVAVNGGTEATPATTALLTVPGSALTTPGPVSVTVSVAGAASNARTFTVVGDTNLTITNESALGTRTAGTTFSVDLEATGGNGNYTWSLATGSALPPGLSLNAGTGVISGTLNQAGSFSFTVRVTDNATPVAATGQKAFTLTVQDFVVSTTSLPEARVGVNYTATLAVGGGPTATAADYQWTLVSGTNSLPGGINFNATTGTFSGVAAPIGTPSQTFAIQVSARHTPSGLTTPARSLQLVVTGGGLDISVTSLPVGIVNQPYGTTGTGITITPVNGTAPYTIELTQAAQLRLQAAGLLGVATTNNSPAPPPSSLRISGTPTIAGSISVEIVVRDAANTQVTRSLPLLVLANSLGISPDTLPSAVINTDYSQQLTATGLSPEELNVVVGQSAVTWTLVGNVPGLSLSATTGLLTGRFTTLGVRQVTVQASTRLRQTTRTFSLTVEGPRPTITTTTLPGATVGQAYSAEVSATGGSPGYTWQVAGVTLPAGLSFDAGTVNSGTLRIAGTPTVGAQSRTFTLTVRDTAGQTASREFTIAVVSAPIPAVEQKDVVVTLAQTYPVALQGTATVAFTPNATNNADDPAIRFLNGQRTANFSIPAGTTQAVFEGAVAGQRLQTGTVAGTVRVTVSIQGGPTASQEFTVARSAPFLQDNLTLQPTASGFNVVITGYSTPRDLSSAQITFAPTSGTNLGTTQLTVPLTEAATQWFQGSTGQANGSAFRLTLPFTVQNGSNAVASVTVTLSNSVGASNSRTRAF